MVTNPFPPSGPTTLTTTIPSYLYVQYADDDALQAFVVAYNQQVQNYVAWFATGQLANYTVQVGLLLDWVAEGLYGMVRPSLSSQVALTEGPFNTFAIDGFVINGYKVLAPQNIVAVSDDVFKRIMTWNFYKGDGSTFSVQWLKRRCVQFLNGTNGVPISTANTQAVSVSVAGSVWTITLNAGIRTIQTGPFNTFTIDGIEINGTRSTFTPSMPTVNAQLLQEAMNAGVLIVPFEYTFVVNVG